MKTITYIHIVIFNFLVILSVNAQSSDKIIVTGSRFTYPLLERWIAEYKKINPALNIKVNPRGGPDTDIANLIINAHVLWEQEIKTGFKVIDVNRYVLLTVANSKSEFAKEYSKTGIKDKDIKKLFFSKWDPFGEEASDKKKKAKEENKVILYTREQIACAPTTFAHHYGFEQKDLVGKGIAGDDKHLIQAVIKDTNSVTYNNLGFIYDLKTRKVKNELTIIPVDLNNNGKLDPEENFYDTLDDVVAKVEDKNYSDIVIGKVNFSFPENVESTNKELYNFISWILTEGAQYNHEFGFLDQDKASLSKQIGILNTAK